MDVNQFPVYGGAEGLCITGSTSGNVSPRHAVTNSIETTSRENGQLRWNRPLVYMLASWLASLPGYHHLAKPIGDGRFGKRRETRGSKHELCI